MYDRRIVHKYFPERFQFDELELNRIIVSGLKSDQRQRIIELVKKENAEKGTDAITKSESEGACRQLLPAEGSQKGTLHFPFGAKDAPTHLHTLRSMKLQRAELHCP